MSDLPKYHSLFTILNRVRTIIDNNVSGKQFWLKVEIANINFHRTGHIYLELAENKDSKTIAKCNAMIWGSQASLLKTNLKSDYFNILKKGNEILCLATIKFKEAHGLSILVSDINIEFAVGKIEQKRKETIEKLKKEGLLELNKKINIPIVIKSIALITSKNTSGYQDFVKNIQDNNYGYKFNLEIFSSAVQGEAAKVEIINNLIAIDKKKYDCVVIIRGGGSKMDLDVFNSYEISKQVSQMQNAVFSGIGHETDVSVLDYAVNKAFKTPTEVANFIINKSYNFEQKIINCYSLIIEKYTKILENRQAHLKLFTEGIVSSSNSFTQLRRGSLHTLMNRLISGVNDLISTEKKTLALINQEQLQQSKRAINNQQEKINKKLEMLELLITKVCDNKRAYLTNALIIISTSSPKVILNKGFTIPRVNGKLYEGEDLPKDTLINLEFKDKVIITKYVKKETRWKLNPFRS